MHGERLKSAPVITAPSSIVDIYADVSQTKARYERPASLAVIGFASRGVAMSISISSSCPSELRAAASNR